jgi:hypothetical protein
VQSLFGDERHAAAAVVIGGTQRKDFLGIRSQGKRYELPHAFLSEVNDRGEIASITAYRDNASTAHGQHAGHKMSDAEIIKLSLSAAPKAIAKDATVIDIGADGKARVVRQGKGEWTCMPGRGNPKAPDPMCGDKNAMAWATAWMGKNEPPANQVGFMYMLRGDNGASNTDPYATEEKPGNNWVKTGSQVMIVGSGAKMLAG